MTSIFRLALLCGALLIFVSCGKGPDAPAPGNGAPSNPGGDQQPQKPVPPPPGHGPAPQPGPNPNPPTNPNLGYYHKGSLWSHVKGSGSWTNVVVQIIRARMRDLEQARDVETFCPGYMKSSYAQRELCWLRLVGGIVEFESSFKPDEKPFYEGNGVYSVGLMALSNGECPNAPTTRLLMNPLLNLSCGVNKMANLINRGKAIDDPAHRGACAYWSTLRPPHKAQLPSGRWVILGKKDKIIERTRKFRQY